MKQKVTVTSVARPWQYKNRAAENVSVKFTLLNSLYS